ncbi:sugar nucleotide-binding protein [Streptomyces sp. NPDC004596]
MDDQRGRPIWTAELAGLLARLGEAAARGIVAPGVHHGTAAHSTTRYALARETFRLLGADPDRVRPTTSATLARPRAPPGVQRPRPRPVGGRRPDPARPLAYGAGPGTARVGRPRRGRHGAPERILTSVRAAAPTFRTTHRCRTDAHPLRPTHAAPPDFRGR